MLSVNPLNCLCNSYDRNLHPIVHINIAYYDQSTNPPASVYAISFKSAFKPFLIVDSQSFLQ